jgi:hypothetical protein
MASPPRRITRKQTCFFHNLLHQPEIAMANRLIRIEDIASIARATVAAEDALLATLDTATAIANATWWQKRSCSPPPKPTSPSTTTNKEIVCRTLVTLPWGKLQLTRNPGSLTKTPTATTSQNSSKPRSPTPSPLAPQQWCSRPPDQATARSSWTMPRTSPPPSASSTNASAPTSSGRRRRATSLRGREPSRRTRERQRERAPTRPPPPSQQQQQQPQRRHRCPGLSRGVRREPRAGLWLLHPRRRRDSNRAEVHSVRTRSRDPSRRGNTRTGIPRLPH